MSKFFNYKTETRGCGRELYLTPLSTIAVTVKKLLELRPELKKKYWIDPCAYDGRWEKVFRAYGVKGESYDIKPCADNVKKQDFLCSTTHFDKDNLFFIGNPPFTKVKDFINKSLSLADSCFFLGGSAILSGTLSPKVDLLFRYEGAEGNHKDKRSKIAFLDSNEQKVCVWTCGAYCTKKEHTPFAREYNMQEGFFRVSVPLYCKENTRVITIKEN